MENTYGYNENITADLADGTIADNAVEQDTAESHDAQNSQDTGTATDTAKDDGDVYDNLEAFKQKMDASVERLEKARAAMHAADEEYDKVRESRNETVAQAEKEANEKIAEVRDREMAVVADVRREADDVLKSGTLTRDLLGALGYSKVTKRRVAAKKNK